jgi:carbon monoxide dehydrogenase subunit G
MALASRVLLADPQDVPRVEVVETGGLYTVTASFAVPATAGTVMAVLSDYARIPKYMPDVQVSRVIERTADGAVVEQEAVTRFMLFSKRIYLLLDVREEASALRFSDQGRRSFATYHGAWVLTESDSLTVVDYQLSAKPSFEVPGFVLKRLLKRDAAQLIDRIKVEIAAHRNGRQ